MSDGFDPLEISARKPLAAIAKVCFWIGFGIPVGVGLLWGYYKNDSIGGVVGVSIRRAGGAAITETRPIGEAFLNSTEGKGLRPGDSSGQQLINQSVRPSELRKAD